MENSSLTLDQYIQTPMLPKEIGVCVICIDWFEDLTKANQTGFNIFND